MRAYQVEVEIGLTPTRPVTADDVTDLLETVVDELDELGMDPSVTSSFVGDELTLCVEVSFEQPADADVMDVFSVGFSAVRSALHAARVVTAGMVVATRIEPRLLQPTV